MAKKVSNNKSLQPKTNKPAKINMQSPRLSKSSQIFLALMVLTGILLSMSILRLINNDNSGNGSADIVKQMLEQNKELIMAQDGDITGAVSLLNSQIAQATTLDQKVTLLNKLANVYMVASKPQEAVQAARKAIALKNNAASWVVLGKAYEQSKDYKNAVFAYQQAVNLSLDSKEDGRGDYATYNGYLARAKARQ